MNKEHRQKYIREYNKKYYKLHGKEICKKRNKGIQNTRDLACGEIFGLLTVIKLYGKNKDGRICYTCKCRCGNEKIVLRSYLLSGRVKSCGCLKAVTSSITGKKYIHFASESRRKFCGNVSGTYWNHILHNATARGIKVTITHRFISELLEKQNGKCALTGLLIIMSPLSKNRCNNTASLDRINSNDGYIEGNVRWVHKDVNLMKNQFSDIRFKEICKLVLENDTRSTR